MDPQAVIERAVVLLGHGMHRPHPLGEVFLLFGPHQVDVAMLAAEIQRIGRVAAEIEERAALLIRLGRVGGQAHEIIDLALVVDLVAGPSLLEDLDHLARALVTELALGLLARKIRGDDIQRQAAFQHVIERGDGARQHDRLHLAAADRSQQVDLRGDRRAARNEAQRVLPDLVGGGAQDVAKALGFGGFHDVRAMRPGRTQVAFGFAQEPVIIRAERCEP